MWGRVKEKVVWERECNCLTVSTWLRVSPLLWPCGLNVTSYWWEDTCAIRLHTKNYCIIITPIHTLQLLHGGIHYPPFHEPFSQDSFFLPPNLDPTLLFGVLCYCVVLICPQFRSSLLFSSSLLFTYHGCFLQSLSTLCAKDEDLVISTLCLSAIYLCSLWWIFLPSFLHSLHHCSTRQPGRSC